MRRQEQQFPFVLVGVIVALVLIVVTFRGSPPRDDVLNQRFAPRPTDPMLASLTPEVTLPELPPELQTKISDLAKDFAGGAAIPALTPTAQGQRVLVTVQELRRTGDQVSVRGSVQNVSSETIAVRPESFIFRDSTGTTYATEGRGATELAAGAETSFDLAVPLANGLGLSMIVSLPPDPPVEQLLIVQTR